MKTGVTIVVFLTVILMPFYNMAQDTTVVTDSTVADTIPKQKFHSPKKAAYMSILPGLGQIYNRKYWKVPIIYAGLGTALYFAVDNNKKYIEYRDAYISRIDDDTTNDNIMPYYNTEDLRQLKNYYWKYRDMSILIMAAIWALNILDATVDAHLYSFDISDDLSLRIQPEIDNGLVFGRKTSFGLSISLTF